MATIVIDHEPSVNSNLKSRPSFPNMITAGYMEVLDSNTQTLYNPLRIYCRTATVLMVTSINTKIKNSLLPIIMLLKKWFYALLCFLIMHRAACQFSVGCLH